MKNASRWLVWVALAAAFAGVALELFQLGLQRGEIFPAGSSLRTGPLGTKVLHDTLERFWRVERNHEPQADPLFWSGRPTVFVLALPHGGFHTDGAVAGWEAVPTQGGRLVVGFERVLETRADIEKSERELNQMRERLKSKKKREASPSPSPSPVASATPSVTPVEAAMAQAELHKRLGFEVKIGDAVPTGKKAIFTLPNGKGARLSWKSTLYFDALSPEWRVIAKVEGKPVVVERTYGTGTVVLAGDNYFLSNEALWRERSASLLHWVVGDPGRVIFEETHLGDGGQAGVATLIRKYQLNWAIAILALGAGLFIWQNATSLVPKLRERASGDDVASGMDATTGLAHLLQRHVTPGSLLTIFREEWQNHIRPTSSKRTRERVEKILGNPKPHPVEAYNQIQAILSEREL